MLRNDLAKQKIKRVLVVYREFERSKLNHEGSMQVMEYMFNISARWMEDILRSYDLADMKEVELPHIDLDLIFIDQYMAKVQTAAKKERKTQMQIFS